MRFKDFDFKFWFLVGVALSCGVGTFSVVLRIVAFVFGATLGHVMWLYEGDSF